MLKIILRKEKLGMGILLFLLLCCPNVLLSNRYETRKDSVNRTLNLSYHLNYAMYRDFATSPLFYDVIGGGVAIGEQFVQKRGEHLYNFNMQAHIGSAQFYNFNLYYHYIHDFRFIKSPKWDLKLGGAFLYTQNIRVNPPLRNAQAGLEALMNFMVVGKIKRDLSRTNSKNVQFLWIKKELRPVKREITFTCQVGLLNFNFRPNQYSFVYLGSINGTATNPAMWLFEEYSWSMNGWRLGTQLEYSWFMKSGNGRKIAYIWEVAHCPGNFEPFEMAIHKLQYTIIINNNK